MRRPGLVIGLVAAVVLGGGYSFIQSEIASANLASLEPAGNSVAVANDGKTTLGHIASSGGEKGKQLPSDKIPMPCRHTHMAAEDRRFYTHAGVEWSSAARAVLGNVENGFGSEGASTITMQLAKEYAGTEKILKRKARQVIYAWRLEQDWGKDKILDAFLNHNYYGRGTYGVEDASQTWFGVSAAELKDMNDPLHVARCAFLAALIKAPSTYSEYEGKPSNLTHATEIWNRVTKDVLGGMRLLKGLPSGQKMAEEKVIEDAKKLGLAGLNLTNTVKNAGNGVDGDLGLMAATREWTRGWQIEVAKQDGFKEAEAEKVGRGAADEMLARGGLKFTLSIDPKMQPLAVKSHKDNMSSNASAVVILDQRTGGVLAMSGSRDYNADPRNYAIYEPGHVGSTLKPFILLAATRSGISLNSELPAPGSITIDGPPIEDHGGRGEPGCKNKMNLVDSLAVSHNVVFVQAATGRQVDCQDPSKTVPIPNYPVNLGTVEKTLRDAGVDASLVPGRNDPVEIRKEPRLAIGSNDTLNATPLKLAVMTNSIATGHQRKPFLISKIEGLNGVIFEHKDESRRVFEDKQTAPVAYAMTQVYKHPQGTARGAQVPYGVGGKTGTADSEVGASWFISFNASSSKYKKEPAVVCAARETKNPKSTGASAAKVCQQFYNGTLKQKNVAFPQANLDAGTIVGLNAKTEPAPASKQPEPAKPSAVPALPSKKPAQQESPLPSPSPQKSGSPLQNGLQAVLPSSATSLLPSWR